MLNVSLEGEFTVLPDTYVFIVTASSTVTFTKALDNMKSLTSSARVSKMVRVWVAAKA